MTTFNISLPDDLGAFIDSQVALSGYSSASEYIGHLIRQDLERVAQKQLETLLLEGLDSGDPIEATDSWWEQKRAALVERLHQSSP